MALNIFFNDDNTVTVPTTLPFTGIYIPIADLPGMDAAELATSVSENEKQGKTIYSITLAVNNYLSANTNTLGESMTVANPIVVGTDLLKQSYSLVVDYLVDVSQGLVQMIPTPTSGVYLGIGDFSLTDVFPTIFTVPSTDNTADASGIGAAGAGVLISTDDLDTYGFFNDVLGSDITTINITADNRYALASIFQSICDGNVAVRTTSIASGITAISISDASTQAIPTTYTQATNPLSGISDDDRDHVSFSRRTYTITFELSTVPANFEINNTTS